MLECAGRARRGLGADGGAGPGPGRAAGECPPLPAAGAVGDPRAPAPAAAAGWKGPEVGEGGAEPSAGGKREEIDFEPFRQVPEAPAPCPLEPGVSPVHLGGI